ncbi:MAG: hypothetical protein M3301_10045 [Chloroflexota bacterium]|nr:hypothetical protein [Chloroflexota bacterium]
MLGRARHGGDHHLYSPAAAAAQGQEDEMHATYTIENIQMLKLESGHVTARTHRLRALVGPEDGSPRPPSLERLWRGERRRLAGVATVVVGLAMLAVAALG